MVAGDLHRPMALRAPLLSMDPHLAHQAAMDHHLTHMDLLLAHHQAMARPNRQAATAPLDRLQRAMVFPLGHPQFMALLERVQVLLEDQAHSVDQVHSEDQALLVHQSLPVLMVPHLVHTGHPPPAHMAPHH